MKIAFVTPAYYPAIIGASLYSTELAERLVKIGHDVSVFTPFIKGFLPKEEINGVEVARIKKTELGHSFYVSFGMVKQIAKQRFDIIHSHHYGYFPSTAGFIAAKLRKTPHVFGPYYHPPVYGMKRKLLFSVYHFTQGYNILRFSDAILPHTEYEKNLLIRIGANEENMRILPNIVDTNKFLPSRKKEKIVLFVNNLIHEKGAHTALDIAKQITDERNDVKFVFIGNPYRLNLLPKINELSKRKNVIFLKNLGKDELIKWYQRSLIFMLPSKYEAFSRVTAEAQACGCTAVVTKVGGLPEVVENNKTGYVVEYGDWIDMKNKINYLLDNPKEAINMGKRGTEIMRKKFDSRIIMKELIKIYEEIL